MPITADHAGKAYAPTAPYEVTRGKVVEFAAALGDHTVAVMRVPVVPPTFAAVIVNPAWDAMFADPELELSLSRIVHADQQFRYRRPLEPGDVVTAALTIDKVRIRAGAEFVVTSVEVHDEVGEVVLSATSTFVHTRADVA